MKVVEQFKRRILDLAIRGKLVPQDPNDEPASILLERIKAEKAKLVKAGKIKKEKNPSEIVVGSDGAAYEKFGRGDLSHAEARRRGVDVPFDLPQGWAWARLGEIAEVQLGKMLDKKNITGVLYPYLANVSVRWGAFDLDNLKKMPFSEAEVVKFALKTGDIIMCEGGVPGRCAVWREDTACVKYQKALHRIRVYEILPEFVRYYFEAIHETMFFTSRFSGSTIHHLPRETLIQIQIPIPPVDEQKRIVAKIEELFSLADLLGTAADGLENAAKRLDKKILDLAIRGKLVPQDPNDEPASELVKRIAASHKSPSKNQSEPIDPPFEIPDSWEWVRLGTITNYGKCKSIDAKSILPDTWLLDLEEIEKVTGRLLARRTAAEKKSSSSKHVFCRGMVLYSKLRTYLNKVLVADMDGVCTSEIVPISVVDGVCPEYLCLALTSQYFLQYTASRGYGVKMPRVGTNDMRSALIPLPPLNEQKRIVKRVEALKDMARTL